jgi:hypothetical protein
MDLVETLVKLAFYLAIIFGVDAFFAQMVLFLLASFHVTAGFWQAFFMVTLLAAIAGGSAKATS